MITEVLHNVIMNIPEDFRYLAHHGILYVPIDTFFIEYQSIKDDLLNDIQSMPNSEINSMHRYSYENPLSDTQISGLNDCIYPFISELNRQYQLSDPEYYTGFSIIYNRIQRNLGLHRDDSLYTINMCLKSTAEENEVVFQINRREIVVPIEEDYMLIHYGNIPHYTRDLLSGERINIVMWFK